MIARVFGCFVSFVLRSSVAYTETENNVSYICPQKLRNIHFSFFMLNLFCKRGYMEYHNFSICCIDYSLAARTVNEKAKKNSQPAWRLFGSCFWRTIESLWCKLSIVSNVYNINPFNMSSNSAFNLAIATETIAFS